jgi:hypothetical protein
MSKISMEMIWGRIKQIKDYQLRWHSISHIILHLKWLFTHKANAELIWWHAEGRKTDGMLHHLDGIEWMNFDGKHKDFKKEIRNIRFGLTTDGMNPFGDIGVTPRVMANLITLIRA